MKNSILDYKIFNNNLDSISIDENCIINTINPHSYVVAKKDKVFNQALHSSDVLLPDGIGVVYAMRLLKSEKIKRIAGHEAFIYLMNELNQKKGKCFFLGASNETLGLIRQKVNIEYPNVNFNSFSPPFKAQFSDEDNVVMRMEINKVSPDVLFVGMTAPKQEKWVYKNRDDIDAKVICSIGAVFDFYAETVKRPSKIWIFSGLEWLIRLAYNPKRLWKRTFISMPIFIKDVLVCKAKAMFK